MNVKDHLQAFPHLKPVPVEKLVKEKESRAGPDRTSPHLRKVASWPGENETLFKGPTGYALPPKTPPLTRKKKA